MNSESLQSQHSIEQCFSLAKEGKVYNALTSWFKVPQEQRMQVVKDALIQASQRESILSYAKQNPDLTLSESFVLNYFSTITSPVVEKLFNPSEETRLIDAQRLDDIGDVSIVIAHNHFITMVSELEIEFEAESDSQDFRPPARAVIQRFSPEEMQEFLLNIIPYIESESDLFKPGFIIDPIKHIDLLVDSRLSSVIERSVAVLDLFTWLIKYLSNRIFPKPEIFEKLFSIKSDEADPNRKERLIHPMQGLDVVVPASLAYFTFLRRINQVSDVYLKQNVEKVNLMKQRIVSYLLNDSFMLRAIPYLETDELYGDEFVTHGPEYFEYRVDIEAMGDEAKRIKRQRFAEIIKAAASYLDEIGDTETIQQLKNREIASIRFADFIN